MAAFPGIQQPPSTAAGRRSSDWWNTTGFAIVALLLAAMPLLWPAIPPLIDLPAHMGSYHVALNAGASTTLDKYFEFHWAVIGNLGVDLLVMPLAKLVGVELATKIVVILIPVLTVGGMLWTAREIHGELPPTLGFALPLAYCFPFVFGFVNYCLSMAFMLLGFALWLRLGRQERPRWRAAVFAALAVCIWITHAVGWVLLVAACASAELHRRIRQGQSWRGALMGSAIACAPLCTPVLVMASLPHHLPSSVGGWFVPRDMARWLLSLFRDRWMAWDLAALALFFGVLLLAAVRRGGMRLQSALAVPALALVVLFVAAPESINHSDFVNVRIAPYALALLAIAIGTPHATAGQRRGLAIAASAFFVLRMASTAASMALYSADYSANLKALDHIEAGSAIVAFSPVSCEHGFASWQNPRVYHLPSMAVVRRNAFVNTEWQVDGLQLLKVRYAAARPFDSDPSEMVALGCDIPGALRVDAAIASFPRAAFDYLWLLEMPPSAWPHDPAFELVWAKDNAALYRIVH
jgi:hypothetical protein